MRPAAIVNFERLYLGSLLVSLLATALGWSAAKQQLMENPQFNANPQAAQFAMAMLPAGIVVMVGVTLLLWFFIARRPSVVAKWIMVVLTALGALAAIGKVAALVRGTAPVAATATGLVATALAVAAAAMLFRPDARAWLGERSDVPPPVA